MALPALLRPCSPFSSHPAITALAGSPQSAHLIPTLKLNPPKTKFMIDLSIQDFIPFLVLYLFPPQD